MNNFFTNTARLFLSLLPMAILAMLFSASIFIAIQLVSSGSPNIKTESFSAAFWGAAFAFLFLKLGDISTGILSRSSERFHAKIRLTQVLNENLNYLSAYQRNLEQFIESLDIQVDVEDKCFKLLDLRVFKMEFEASLIYELGHFELGNDAFRVFTLLKHLSWDSKNLFDVHQKSVEIFLIDRKENSSYINNCAALLLDAEKHKAQCIKVLDQLVYVLSIARIIVNSEKKWMFPRVLLNHGEYSKRQLRMVQNERERIANEVQKNAK